MDAAAVCTIICGQISLSTNTAKAGCQWVRNRAIGLRPSSGANW